jgi:ribosome recycling factor
MNDDSVLILEMAEEKMSKAIAHLEEALLSVRAGKASQHVLKGIMVEYYGMATPIEQVSSVTVPDAKTILIQPWDRNMIAPIERAILVSNIGLTPSNNGEHIRELVLPEGVTVIHEKAFEDFFLLETITIPSSVTAIEADAFANAAPSRILYGGTMEQWHDIVLGDDWFKESILVAYPVIHCTDGEIILPSRWNR